MIYIFYTSKPHFKKNLAKAIVYTFNVLRWGMNVYYFWMYVSICPSGNYTANIRVIACLVSCVLVNVRILTNTILLLINGRAYINYYYY